MSRPTQTHTPMTNADKEKQAQNNATAQADSNIAVQGPGTATLEKTVPQHQYDALEKDYVQLSDALAAANLKIGQHEQKIQTMTVQMNDYEKLTKDGVVKQTSTDPAPGSLAANADASKAPAAANAAATVPVHQAVKHQGSKSEQIVEVGARAADEVKMETKK